MGDCGDKVRLHLIQFFEVRHIPQDSDGSQPDFTLASNRGDTGVECAPVLNRHFNCGKRLRIIKPHQGMQQFIGQGQPFDSLALH